MRILFAQLLSHLQWRSSDESLVARVETLGTALREHAFARRDIGRPDRTKADRGPIIETALAFVSRAVRLIG